MIRIWSIFVALWLQASPVIHWLIDELEVGNLSAFVIRIGGVSAALIGGAQAMSGATTWVSSTNPPIGRVGSGYTYRLQTAGNHSAGSWSSSTLPSGLSIVPSAGQFFVQGTPTVAGTTTVTLTAWENSNRTGPSVSGSAKFAFTNAPPSGVAPSISTPPRAQRRLPGTNATFAVVVTGTSPLAYQWRKDNSPLAGQTNSIATLSNLTSGSAGSIVVVVTNLFGSITSTPVNLLIATPPTITNSLLGPNLHFQFSGETGVTYRVESSPTADFAAWTTVTNFTPLLDGFVTLTNSPPPATNTFFRLRLLSP